MMPDMIREAFGAEAAHRVPPDAPLELAVHGLDLAAALDREPWVTVQAAEASEDLLLPPAAAGRLRAETGWDRVGLIVRLTGRHPVAPSEAELIQSAHIGRLALG
jgi:hypothetical protein